MWSGVSFWKERAAANQGDVALCLSNTTTAHKSPSEDLREADPQHASRGALAVMCSRIAWLRASCVPQDSMHHSHWAARPAKPHTKRTSICGNYT
jgi:hypothetical protein